MIELPLVFAAGLLGSAHCVGMCGGFVAVIGTSASSWTSNLARQSLYSVGRITTYVFLGACAAFAGHKLISQVDQLVLAQGLLALLAGLLLCYQGIRATGLWQNRFAASSGVVCKAATLFRSLLVSARPSDTLVAGVLTGFLPCGLVYAHLTLAASQADVGRAAVLMAVFGLGTVPILVLTGGGLSVLGIVGRRRLLKVAAWCVVLTGLLTVNRGVAAIRAAGSETEAACPLCEEPDDDVGHQH